MASLDVESLFTNITLEETIDNIINDLFLTTDKFIILKGKNLNDVLLLQHMNLFLFLIENVTLKLMVLLWDPFWAQHFLMFLCVILRKMAFRMPYRIFTECFQKIC